MIFFLVTITTNWWLLMKLEISVFIQRCSIQLRRLDRFLLICVITSIKRSNYWAVKNLTRQIIPLTRRPQKIYCQGKLNYNKVKLMTKENSLRTILRNWNWYRTLLLVTIRYLNNWIHSSSIKLWNSVIRILSKSWKSSIL